MTAGMNMTLCPSDETLAAFIDGRLTGADRQAVLDHLAGCAECRDIVLMADEVREAEGLPANVVEGSFGQRWLAPAAIAASLAVVVFLSWDQITNQFNGGMTEVVATYEGMTERIGKSRISGVPFKPLKKVFRGPGEASNAMQYKYQELNAEKGERSWKEYRALAAAALLAGNAAEAVSAIERAASLAPNEPSVINDRAAAYIELARSNPYDKPSAARALAAADRAWKLAPGPQSAWNRAVAFEVSSDYAQAIKAWEAYLELDAASEWAIEARDHLTRAKELL